MLGSSLISYHLPGPLPFSVLSTSVSSLFLFPLDSVHERKHAVWFFVFHLFVCFWIWLISVYTEISSSIHFLKMAWFFILWLSNISLCAYTTFLYVFISGQASSGTISTGMWRRPLRADFGSFGETLRDSIVGSYGSSNLVFWETFILVP